MKRYLLNACTIFLILSVNQSYAVVVSVGDFYGGGTVFCVSNTPDITQCVTVGSGKYGLIMANEDQANHDSPNHGAHWSSVRADTGARSEDDGLSNTRVIIAALPNDTPSNNAAKLCASYGVSPAAEGLSAWYLPSKNELNKMYIYARTHNLIGRNCGGGVAGGAQCLIGGHDQSMWYWSSTEGSSYGAWSQGFGNGSQYSDNKISGYVGVRAVRAFNHSTIQQFNNLTLQWAAPLAALVSIAEYPDSDLENLTFVVGHPDADVDVLNVVAAHPNANAVIQEQIALRLEEAHQQALMLEEAQMQTQTLDSGFSISVGDPYGGGTVFCVSNTPDITQCVTVGSGKYGLIMANEDQANHDSPNHGVHWSSVRSDTGARSEDDGLSNTRVIIAALPNDTPSNNAAKLCASYGVSPAAEGLSAWYLPSKNELNKMYIYARTHNLIGRNCGGGVAGGAQCLIGGHHNYKIYWSSTESFSGYAWSQLFSVGGQSYGGKIEGYFGVRAVRAFNHSTIQQFNNLTLQGAAPLAAPLAALVSIDEDPDSDLEDLTFVVGLIHKQSWRK